MTEAEKRQQRGPSPSHTPASPRPARRPRKRRHLHLIDPKDSAEILPDRRIYTCAPLTRWRIEVIMDDPYTPEYEAAFRAAGTAEPDDQESAMFTLSLQGTGLYPLKVYIWPNNEIEYESHVPLVFRVHPRKKVITVRLLASVKAVPEGVEVRYKQ